MKFQKAQCSGFGSSSYLHSTEDGPIDRAKTGLLFDKRAQSKDVIVSIVYYLVQCTQIITMYYSPPNVTGVSNFLVIIGF